MHTFRLIGENFNKNNILRRMVLMYVKVVEVIGESQNSWKGAVQNAVKDASRRFNNITGVEVYNLTADVVEGDLVDYKANVKIAYTE
jgi:flavin-binding protein dodecin